MWRFAPPLLFALLRPVAAAPPQEPPPGQPRAITIRQQGSADLVGADDAVIQAGLARLHGGGTLILGPGRYVVRRAILPPKNIVLRGEEGAILALPSPVLTAEPAAADARELVLASAGEFAPGTWVQVLPPAGSDFFADGRTRSLDLQRLERAEGTRLAFLEPLEVDIPAASRVGYANKLLVTCGEGLTTIENLTFEGGRSAEIPMPGHFQRCAVWAGAPFGFGEKRLGPPGSGVTVRHCRFTDWYGRGVALYNMTDSLIEGCVFERVADEAIDVDHFCERVRAVGNDVRDALWGIVLNDASRCTIEYNRIEGCDIGIWNWWYGKTPQDRINEENVIRHNVVRGAREAAIHIGRTCHRNVIEHNFVEGEIVVEEPTNSVAGNTRL